VNHFTFRSVQSGDKKWVSEFIAKRWGSEVVVVHGSTYIPADLTGILALEKDKPVGLITYVFDEDECEIVTVDSLSPARGIGTVLINEVKERAREAGCRRLWLITTNDNLDALRFYQKRGFSLVAIHRNAIQKSREIKPEIPDLGRDDIPIRDEIELEMIL
jgi:GNAT superfamily N-acetyltransferase